MAITQQRVNNVTLTKADLTAAIQQYLIQNNIDGAEQTAGNYELVSLSSALDSTDDATVVITLSLPVTV